ncbi:MAG TPA: hypothetical protein VHD76_05860 [Bryobacteraceae bacterium]|jgi:hypothetical protein|nr:hypothetical protein [Bryobacteraceae bacterium]
MISNIGHKSRQFIHHVVPGVIRPLRVLWNEVIGFIFLVLAGTIIVSTIRRAGDDPNGFWVMVFGIGFGLAMAGFGLSSFLRARKISRS